jgi:methyl-accepting chemotaxis protein
MDMFDSNEKQELIFKNRLGAIYSELFTMFNSLSLKKLKILKENRDSQKQKGTALILALIIIATFSTAAIFIAFFLLIRAIIQPITITGQKLEELSEQGGDLSHLLPVVSHDEVGEMTKSFNAFLTNLRHIVGTVKDSTEELNGISRSISSGTTDASSKISETSAFADDISARLSEATNHIVVTVESMEKVTKIISSVSKKSDNSSRSLNDALESMLDIQGASKEITEINEVVNEIAFQINILSLNAAIEAARAGEYGKGFAVVAEEVRELSIKTTESAAKIKQLIHTTNSKIESGSKLVEQTSSMLLEILSEFKSIFNEIDRRTGELKSNTERIEQIDKAVENVRNIINENAAYIEEMAAASEDMANHVKSLHGEVKRFKV